MLLCVKGRLWPNNFLAFAVAASLPVNPASKLYNENYAKQFKYDLKQVQTILSNAGLKDYDEDGFLEIKNGETLTEIDINFLVFSGSTVKVNMAQKFAEDMKSVGIKVTVNKQDWEHYRALINAGNYDMYYAEVRLNSDFDPSKLLMTSANLNLGLISDEKLEGLISEYLEADDDNDADTDAAAASDANADTADTDATNDAAAGTDAAIAQAEPHRFG